MKPGPLMMLMLLIMLISLNFLIWGNLMHNQVTRDEATFHALQEQYWNIDKATRDVAPANSALTNQLVDIKNAPSDLLRLKLVGVGRILTGIYFLLFGILIALIVMPVRLSKMMMKKG